MAAEQKTEAKRGIALVESVAQAAADNAAKNANEAARGAETGAAATKMGAATATKMGAATATKMMEDGASQARVKMEQGMQQMTKTTEGFYKAAEEAAEFGRGNLEAMTRATQTLTTGMQELSKQYFAMSQAMGEHAMESAKALSGVKSLKEAADIQAAFAKASMERTMAETAKLQEAAYRLAEQAGAPLAARMTLAVEKFSKPLAA